MDKTKICKQCQKKLPANRKYFYFDKINDSLKNYCKTCMRLNNRINMEKATKEGRRKKADYKKLIIRRCKRCRRIIFKSHCKFCDINFHFRKTRI